MVDNTFGGRVHFEVMTACFYTEQIQEGLQKRFDEALPDLSEKEKEEVEQLVFWYSVTEDITFKFDGREKKALKLFKSGWERRDQMTMRELLDFWLKLPYEIRGAWIAEVSAGQELFEVDEAQLPTAALSNEQKEQLADPTSPLANAG